MSSEMTLKNDINKEDEDPIICNLCNARATVFLSLENMNQKQFSFCQAHGELIYKIYDHAESQNFLILSN